VLCVVGKGPAFEDARAEAYGAIEKISFNSMAYRRDIGHRMGA
jgi:phosphoribosylamine-glycine ligase